jgi:biotin-(acetyl-CoA carboxylase) ligase
MPSMWTLDETHLPDSTQDQVAARLIERGPCDEPQPLALFSGCQAAGRGSHGRLWELAADSLALTCAWPLTDELAQLALTGSKPWPAHLTGVVLRAIEAELGALSSLQIKWPNDLWLDRRKVGGLLVERRRLAGRWWWLIGVGLNGRWAGSCPPHLSATGLFDALEPAYDGHRVRDLARPIASQIMTWLTDLEGCQTAEQRDTWLRQSMAVCHERDGLKSHVVEVCLADGRRISGRAEGVAEDGAFCLRTETGLQRFLVGEARIVSLSQSAGWEMS